MMKGNIFVTDRKDLVPAGTDGSIRRVVRGRFSFRVAERDSTDVNFWKKFESWWEPETFTLFDALLGPGKRLLDIGGWIGPTALYAAAQGAEVTVFEPDPVAFGKLEKNLALNAELAEKVAAHAAALTGRDGTVTLWSKNFGNSMSGLDHGIGKSREVEAVDVRQPWIESLLAEASLVKIDIEGGEYGLMAHLSSLLARHRPPLYLSLHGQFIPERDPRDGTPVDATALQLGLLASIAFYRHVFWAEKGVWRALEDPWPFLKARMAAKRLDCALYLCDQPEPSILG